MHLQKQKFKKVKSEENISNMYVYIRAAFKLSRCKNYNHRSVGEQDFECDPDSSMKWK